MNGGPFCSPLARPCEPATAMAVTDLPRGECYARAEAVDRNSSGWNRRRRLPGQGPFLPRGTHEARIEGGAASPRQPWPAGKQPLGRWRGMISFPATQTGPLISSARTRPWVRERERRWGDHQAAEFRPAGPVFVPSTRRARLSTGSADPDRTSPRGPLGRKPTSPQSMDVQVSAGLGRRLNRTELPAVPRYLQTRWGLGSWFGTWSGDPGRMSMASLLFRPCLLVACDWGVFFLGWPWAFQSFWCSKPSCARAGIGQAQVAAMGPPQGGPPKPAPLRVWPLERFSARCRSPSFSCPAAGGGLPPASCQQRGLFSPQLSEQQPLNRQAAPTEKASNSVPAA